MIDPLSLLLYRQAGSHGPIMLMYHSIVAGNTQPSWPWAVSMKAFRAQMDFLHLHGWKTPTMAELLASPADTRDRCAVITFDDGYQDNLPACELLHARGMRATLFVVSGSMGVTPGWPSQGRPGLRVLDTRELRAMADAGMEIGSHTVSHLRMPELDDARLDAETRDSRARLEDLLGRSVTSFAYPYGAWDTRCAEAVKAAGYSGACTTRTGWALRDGNPYSLRRLTIYNDDNVARFVRKLASGTNDVSWSSGSCRLFKRIRSSMSL